MNLTSNRVVVNGATIIFEDDYSEDVGQAVLLKNGWVKANWPDRPSELYPGHRIKAVMERD